MTEATFRVDVADAGSFDCAAGENVLRAMERANLRLVPIGCRGGACGLCRVRVIKGRYLTRPMSVDRVSLNDRIGGIALSCRLHPTSDLRLELAPLPQPGLANKT